MTFCLGAAPIVVSHLAMPIDAAATPSERVTAVADVAASAVAEATATSCGCDVVRDDGTDGTRTGRLRNIDEPAMCRPCVTVVGGWLSRPAIAVTQMVATAGGERVFVNVDRCQPWMRKACRCVTERELSRRYGGRHLHALVISSALSGCTTYEQLLGDDTSDKMRDLDACRMHVADQDATRTKKRRRGSRQALPTLFTIDFPQTCPLGWPSPGPASARRPVTFFCKNLRSVYVHQDDVPWFVDWVAVENAGVITTRRGCRKPRRRSRFRSY